MLYRDVAEQGESSVTDAEDFRVSEIRTGSVSGSAGRARLMGELEHEGDEPLGEHSVSARSSEPRSRAIIVNLGFSRIG
jgi:hypothetical protein